MRSSMTRGLRMRTLVALGLSVSAGCSTLAGIDEDYHQVDEPGATGGSATGGTAGGGAGSGATSGGGSSGSGAFGGSSGSGAFGGSAGVGAFGGTGSAGATGGSAGVGAFGGTGASGGSGGSVGVSCASLGKSCVPAVPSGWSGPVAMSSGASTPPTCGSDYPTQTTPGLLMDNLSAPPATCGCSCQSSAIVSCSLATLNAFGFGTCAGGGSKVADIAVGSGCVPAVVPPVATHLRATGSPVVGSCTPKPSEVITPPSWGLLARACTGASTAGACAGSEVCVPAPVSDKTCVYQSGDLACPAAYTNKWVFYEGLDDARGCTVCGCGNLTGTCTGSVSLHNTANCGDDVKTIPLNTCQTMVASSYAKYSGGIAANTSCPVAPGAGLPTGSATPKNPVTFCCIN